jgi:hypothetical protein
MKMKLTSLVGRYVRLKTSVFKMVCKHVRLPDNTENFFVVAATARGVNKLICYRRGFRITVAPADVVLV